MKKPVLQSLAYSCAFTLVLVSLSGYSSLAQDKKEIKKTIVINNGDTVINGRKLREAKPAEREQLRKEFREMEKEIKGKTIMTKRGPGKHHEVIIRRKNGKSPEVLEWKDRDEDEIFDLDFDGPRISGFFNFDSLDVDFDGDSLGKGFRFRMEGPEGDPSDRIITMRREFDGMPRIRERFGRPFLREMGIGEEERNTQEFNYISTDKDGISSRMNIRLSDAGREQIKKITGSENSKTTLEVTDLSIFPNFSSGKLGLSFNLASRGSLQIQILDNSLKPAFSDKAANFSGTYIKQLSLPRNGIYYLSINQGNSWFIKKMIKE